MTPISDLFTELPVPPQVAGVAATLNCAFLFHSERYGSFWMPYYFTRSPFFHYFPSILCMYVMYLTSLTDYFDDGWSQFRLI